jgi:hypothetical protein
MPDDLEYPDSSQTPNTPGEGQDPPSGEAPPPQSTSNAPGPSLDPTQEPYKRPNTDWLREGQHVSWPLDAEGRPIGQDEIPTGPVGGRARDLARSRPAASRPLYDDEGRLVGAYVPAETLFGAAARVIATHRLSIPVDPQDLQNARDLMTHAAHEGAYQEADLEELIATETRRLRANLTLEREYTPDEVKAAQTRFEALDPDRRALLANALDLTARKRAGEAGVTRHMRAAMVAGNPLIGDDFTIAHYEALLFDLEDYYRAQAGFPPLRTDHSTSGAAVIPDVALGAASAFVGRRGQATEGRSWGPDSQDLDLAQYADRVARKGVRRAKQVPAAAEEWAKAQGVRVPGPTTRAALWNRHRGKAYAFGAAAIVLVIALVAAGILLPALRGQVLPFSFIPTVTSRACTGCDSVTATSDATPTPPVGPTPTPVPTQPTDIYATSATIAFARQSQTANGPPTLVACDGCANDAAEGTQRGQKISGSASGSDGALWLNSSQSVPATATTFVVTMVCLSGVNGCLIPSGAHIYDQSGNGHDCHLTESAYADAGSNDFPQCQEYAIGPITSVTTNFMFGPVACAGTCSAQSGAVTSTPHVGNNAYTNYYTPTNCVNQGFSGASSAATNALNGQLTGGLGAIVIGLQSSITEAWCAYPGNCSARVGSQQQMSTNHYIVCATAGGWKLTANYVDSPTVQKGRISPPSGYALDNSTLSACSSPTIQSVDTANARATLACSASATAYFIWTQAMSDTLTTSVAGKTLAEVQGIAASTAGVVGSSVQISAITPSNANRLPKSSGAISVAPR